MGFNNERAYVYIWLIYANVWQKPTHTHTHTHTKLSKMWEKDPVLSFIVVIFQGYRTGYISILKSLEIFDD